MPFIRTEVKFLFIPREFNDGSLVRIIRSSSRVSFSMSQKFLKSFWNWWMTVDNNQSKIKSTNTKVTSLFPLLYQIIPWYILYQIILQRSLPLSTNVQENRTQRGITVERRLHPLAQCCKSWAKEFLMVTSR